MANPVTIGDAVLYLGDCREVLATLAPESIDAVVTDPPYHLTSQLVRSAFPGRYAGTNGAAHGFMGKQWDGGDVAFRPETWRAVYRVLKPGGHLVAMGGTRTFHRLACAIEDAGFEIRDTISWLYGSGFPKSHDVSKGIDRANGDVRPIVGSKSVSRVMDGSDLVGGNVRSGEIDVTSAASAASAAWNGWGTALKPACELIVLARKPLSEPTIAANVLRWGTGAINVDGCRVEASTADVQSAAVPNRNNLRMFVGDGNGRADSVYDMSKGRWPANVAHDGSDEVTAAFPESGPASDQPRNNTVDNPVNDSDPNATILGRKRATTTFGHADNGGSAARFFYTAKADADDRLGSKHPTVKPLDLMQWLVRLVTPKGGTVLDPFAGTGTTGEAAFREGMRAVLIEAEAEYQADIRRRMALVLAGPDERSRESVKAKGLPYDPGPLFAGEAAWREMWARPFDFSQEPKANPG